MKAYGGVDVYIHIFLTSALTGGECSASRPGRFTPGIHWIGGWVDPRASLATWRRENSWPYWDSNSYPSVFQPVASRYLLVSAVQYTVYFIVITTDRKHFHYSLLGYRSQQWLHLYVFSRRFLVTNLNNQSSPASAFTSFTSLLFEFQTACVKYMTVLCASWPRASGGPILPSGSPNLTANTIHS
jgi:hypothetical protein